MKKSRFTDEQLVGFLRQAEEGIPIKEVCRAVRFNDVTFFKCRVNFVGVEGLKGKWLSELEAENAKLKKPLNEVHLDMHTLKSVLG